MRDVRRLFGDAGRPPGGRRRAHRELYVHRSVGVQDGSFRQALSHISSYEYACT